MRSPVAVSLFVIFLLVASVSGDNYVPATQPAAPAPAEKKAVIATLPVNTNTCDADVITSCDTRCKAHCDNGVGNGPDCRPGRARFANDDPVTTDPGNPGAKQKILYATNQKGDNTIVGGEDVSVGSTFKTICHDKCEDAGHAACRVSGKPDVPEVPKEDAKRVECRKTGFAKCQDKCKAHCNNGLGNGPDCRPGRARFNNDDLVSATVGNGGAKRKIAYDNNIKGDDTTTVAGSDAIVVSTVKHLTKCHDDCEDGVETECANPTPVVVEQTTQAKPAPVEQTQPAKVEKTEPKPAETQAPKPVEQTNAKPVEQTTNKPVEQTNAKPAEQTTNKPAETQAPKPAETQAPKPVVVEAPHPPVTLPVATPVVQACPPRKERAIRVRRENCDNGAQLKKVIETLKCKVSTLLAAVETLNAAKQQQQAAVTKTVDTVVAEAVKAAVNNVVVNQNAGAATGAYGTVGTVKVVERAKSVRAKSVRAKSVRAKSVKATVTAGGYGGKVTVAQRGGSRRGGSRRGGSKVVKVAAAAGGAYGAAAAIKKVRGGSRRGGSRRGGSRRGGAYVVKRRGGSRRGGDRYGAHGRRRRGGSRKGRRGVSKGRRGGYGRRRGGSRKGRRGGDRYGKHGRRRGGSRKGRRGVSKGRRGGYGARGRRGGSRRGGDRYNRSHARRTGGGRAAGGDRYNRSHARTGGVARRGYGGGAARRTGGGARRGGDRY